MNEVTLPPSPNWYLSSILACASDGTVAWGARNSIVIAKAKDDSKKLGYSIIDRAHSARVTSIAFSPKNKEDSSYRLLSGGDDNIIKIWNLQDLSLELKNSTLDVRIPEQLLRALIFLVFSYTLMNYLTCTEHPQSNWC